MGNLVFEKSKALKVAGAKVVNGFAGQRRSTTVNSIKDGIYTVPEYKEVIEAPIRGSYQTNDDGSFKMDAGGNKIPVTVQHIFAQAENGNCVPLYPGSFSKSRQEVTLDQTTGKYTRGAIISASGEVVDWLDNNFLETEDAMQALVTATMEPDKENPNASEAVKAVIPKGLGKKIQITMKPIYTVRYEARDTEDENLTAKDIRKDNIPVVTWA